MSCHISAQQILRNLYPIAIPPLVKYQWLRGEIKVIISEQVFVFKLYFHVGLSNAVWLMKINVDI